MIQPTRLNHVDVGARLVHDRKYRVKPERPHGAVQRECANVRCNPLCNDLEGLALFVSCVREERLMRGVLHLIFNVTVVDACGL
jgi:hypothetical protein